MANGNLEMGRALITRMSRPVRLIVIAILALTLLIPLGMVQSVVHERHQTYRGVIADISGSWSGEQQIAGPMLVVPFTERFEVRDEYATSEGEKKVISRWETCERRAVILPDSLEIEGRLSPETRHRGIYRVQVYTADLVVSGAFGDLQKAIEAMTDEERLEEIDFPGAVVAFGLSDPRGIVNVDGFRFNRAPGQPRPGTTLTGTVQKGFHVPLGAAIADGLEFDMPMVIRGSGNLRFLPLGESSRVVLRSDWPHPSFIGEVLPADREVSDAGFEAEWTIPLLNRSYPQAWTAGSSVCIDEIEAGVRLFEPVALYDMVTRSVKYGLLFIALTFLTLGLIEYVIDVKLSIVQFLLIGVALAMFFLILIALAEHMGFAAAYVLASATVIVINTLYCAAILRRWGISTIVGAVLTAIYGILYLILNTEDFALLGGTVLLVVALSATMFFTRRIHEPGNVPTGNQA
jgi:inner membrane protein